MEVENPEQEDLDDDGVGDACDECPDEAGLPELAGCPDEEPIEEPGDDVGDREPDVGDSGETDAGSDAEDAESEGDAGDADMIDTSVDANDADPADIEERDEDPRSDARVDATGDTPRDDTADPGHGADAPRDADPGGQRDDSDTLDDSSGADDDGSGRRNERGGCATTSRPLPMPSIAWLACLAVIAWRRSQSSWTHRM